MENINAVGIISQPKSLNETIGYSKAAKDVELENDRDWIRRCKNKVVTTNAEVNTIQVELHSQATEVYSADEIRESIQAVMTTKAVMIKLTTQNKATAETEPVPSSTKVLPVSGILEYKPESGDQIYVPQKAKKRRGKPTKAGPSKRSRTKSKMMDDFYVGKLTNICTETNKLTTSDSDSDKRPYFPKPNYGYIWKRFLENK